MTQPLDNAKVSKDLLALWRGLREPQSTLFGVSQPNVKDAYWKHADILLFDESELD